MTPLIVHSIQDAEKILMDPTQRFSVIFINPSVSKPHGLSLVRSAHLHRPATPIILLHDDPKVPFTESGLKALAVVKTARKPLNYASMLRLISPIVPVGDPGTAEMFDQTANPVNNPVLNGTLVQADDSEFIEVRAEEFMITCASFFDIHAKTAPGQYIKIFATGEMFSPGKVARFLAQDIHHFYVRKDAQAQYVSYCETLTAALLKSQERADRSKDLPDFDSW